MHRDIKADNIVLIDDKSKFDTVKIIDFGLSKKFTPGVPITEAVGTPYYVAPEVIAKNYD